MMGFLSDMSDAVKNRIKNPPQYSSYACSKCKGTGICPKCNGNQGMHYTIIGWLIAIGSIYSLISTIDSPNHSTLFGFLSLLGIIVGIAVGSMNECECKGGGGSVPGKCIRCNGEGRVTTKNLVQGTELATAIKTTRKASMLVKEALAAGNLDKVEKNIEKAIRLNPSHFSANAIMGVLLIDKNNSGEALSYLEKAEKIKPKNVDIKHLLIIVYEDLGSVALAEKKKIELLNIGIKRIERKEGVKIFAKGAASGFAAGFISVFLPFYDD